jgi:hypothetical protein
MRAGLTSRRSPFRAGAGLILTLAVLGGGQLAACAGGPARPNAAPRRDPRELTYAQMREGNYVTVFDAVEALKSNWLRERGPSSFINPSRVLVYLDDSRLGGVERLRELNTSGVAFVHWFSGIEASARWGPGHDDGVILVATRLR